MLPEFKRGNVASRVEELCAPVAAECQLSLWDVVYEKEGGAWFLRIYIDKEGGVTIEDCEKFSRLIDPILDEADPIENSYYLEVSSPGIERRLRKPAHFTACMGKRILLRLIRPVEGQREREGLLVGFDKGVLRIRTEKGDEEYKLSETAFVRLVDES